MSASEIDKTKVARQVHHIGADHFVHYLIALNKLVEVNN